MEAGESHDAWPSDKLAAALDIGPSLVTRSGHGLHAYWFLSDPVEATPENIEPVERCNQHWVDTLGADKGTTDASRILKLAGSVSYPNSSKAALGYTPLRVDVIYRDDDAGYTLDEMPGSGQPNVRAPLPAGKVAEVSAGQGKIQLSRRLVGPVPAVIRWRSRFGRY